MDRSEVREQLPLPPEVDVSEGACADLVARVVSRLAPDLARSVGPVQWKHGDEAGVDWTAEGFVDGVLVVVCLRPASREVSLLVEPRFTSPEPRITDYSNFYLLGALAAGIAVGVMKRSIGWGFGALIAVVVASTCVDVLRNELQIRRAL